MIVVYRIIENWYRKEPRVHVLLIYISKNLQNVEFELSHETLKNQLFWYWQMYTTLNVLC